MPLVQLQQVVKSYRLGETQIAALRGVDLVIHEGEFIAVWGPSGSGKSTLCNLIGMLDRPTSGAVLLQGQDVSALSDDERSELRSRTFGFVFQSFNLIPVLSALENVMLPLEIQGKAPSEAADAAVLQMTELGLSDFAHQRPNQLSGGEQQRVALARALITNPSLIVADEPTANLDSGNAGRIIEMMQELNLKKGVTFIFSTHDQRLLAHVDRRILLQDGAIAEDSAPPGS